MQVPNFKKFIDVKTSARSTSRASTCLLKEIFSVLKKIGYTKIRLAGFNKEFKKRLAIIKGVKTPEHPDAETQIKITVKFTIEPEGHISKIQAISSNSLNEEFDKLICDKVSQWTFEKADRSTIVTYPITFDKK